MTEDPSTSHEPSDHVKAESSRPCSFDQVIFRQYTGEEDLPIVMELVDNELSEPYSIFTYRFFLQNWPQLCWFAFDGDKCFGVVVCKAEYHRDLLRGYVGMLVVVDQYRGLGVGSELVRRCIRQMIDDKADEVVLECEVTNKGALSLYQNLGFLRDKRLVRYYLSGNDAFRLKLLLPIHPDRLKEMEAQEVADQMAALSPGLTEGPAPQQQANGGNIPAPHGAADGVPVHDQAQRREDLAGNILEPQDSGLVARGSGGGNSMLSKENKHQSRTPVADSAMKEKPVKGLGNGPSMPKKHSKKRTKKK